jgi:indole-3-glycerol phosphate synthase
MSTKDLTPQAEVVIAAKRHALQDRKSRTPIEAVRALASMQKRPQAILRTVAADAQIMLIGQIKHKSPSGGMLSYDPVAAALRYVKAGVEAVSLFTDENLYQGGLDDLVLVSRATNARIPVISQDYVLDEYQIIEARAAGASALVLSSAILEPSSLRTLLSATHRNSMTAIVQVHDEEELEHALTLSPYVIGLSNRDPWTHQFTGDQISKLRPLIPPDIHVMVTDGLETLAEIEAIIKLGVHAILVCESVLDNPVQVKQLDTLLKPFRSNGSST